MMITRDAKIRNVRDHARAELFEVEQGLHRVVNDFFDVADSVLIAHAADLADALAVIARTRSEMIEESNKQTKQ